MRMPAYVVHLSNLFLGRRCIAVFFFLFLACLLALSILMSFFCAYTRPRTLLPKKKDEEDEETRVRKRNEAIWCRALTFLLLLSFVDIGTNTPFT